MSDIASGPGYESAPVSSAVNEYPYVYGTVEDPNLPPSKVQELLETPSGTIVQPDDDGVMTEEIYGAPDVDPGRALRVEDLTFVKDADNNVYIAGNEDSLIEPL